MTVLENLDQLQQQVDADTLEKVEHTRDYVIRTGQGGLLLSFRWLDHSPVLLHVTPQQASLWTESPDVRKFAKGVEGTGKEELFEFLVALSADDLSHLEELENRIGAFEEDLFESDGKTKENFRLIHRFRKEVWGCKRYFEKMELLTDELMAADEYFLFIDKKYDKLLNQILRTQEYLDQIRQSYEAQVDIEQNSLMKFFTVVTSIFLPLTLIAGWYGMNLMMPEFKWPYGYPFVIALSVAIVAFMIWLFRRNKWL
ncbi:MAG: hypothetical protein IKN20_02310 [Firmicutes bacterium]|nr:hypothetical protein [Bacillota bacterium]